MFLSDPKRRHRRMRLDSVVGAQGNKPPISGLTGCGAAALQRFTQELHTGWQRCPLILTRSVSEASFEPGSHCASGLLCGCSTCRYLKKVGPIWGCNACPFQFQFTFQFEQQQGTDRSLAACPGDVSGSRWFESGAAQPEREAIIAAVPVPWGRHGDLAEERLPARCRRIWRA
jgi:hypothetical protein